MSTLNTDCEKSKAKKNKKSLFRVHVCICRYLALLNSFSGKHVTQKQKSFSLRNTVNELGIIIPKPGILH